MEKNIVQPKIGDWCVVYGSIHGDAVEWGEIQEWHPRGKGGGYGYIINPETKESRSVCISDVYSNMKIFSSKEYARKEYWNNSFDGFIKEQYGGDVDKYFNAVILNKK